MTDSPFSSLYVFFGPYSSPFQSIKKRSRAYTPALTYVKIPCKSAGVFRLEHTSCQALWVEPQYLTIWQKSILTCNAISVEFVIALWNSPVSWEQKSLQKHKLSWDRHEPKLWSQDSESPEHSTLPQNSLQLWFWNHKAEGEKSTLEGRRVVYGVSLLMDYLLSGTPAERDRKVTGNINWRRALAFPEFYTGPAALIHDCPAQGHQFSVRHHAEWNMQFVWL